ncbi:MAG: type III secretion system chaperone [Chthoniobacterales bacterium]
MFNPYSINRSPFTEIASFLANRYGISKEGIKAPLMELLIDEAVPVELQEEGASVYIVGTVVEPILINEDQEALTLLKLASSHLGMTEGTLAWDDLQKRIVFWLEVTSYTRETEFNAQFEKFLNHLDSWIKLASTL